MAIKKTFKAEIEDSYSPASAFISSPTGETKETKSARVNLLFRPSTKLGAEKLAYLKKSSLNDFINTVLDEYIEAHKDDIARYDSFFSS